MFFRRLELHGFKSFGHRTVIDFNEGFTIVVGPNGCGKSNVLDGIRWVLGETSAKALRGGRMGDVVFRGSGTMKPAGLSNVTLTLDNSRGILRMDQEEVSVTRRLFSNGDSEYKINKVACRMRDVHEMFLDTGLGADGYSVIEQGQIGQMVAAKPRERRDLFEEAAGISRYKMRREETVRKLARTDEDLQRLTDLVSEVERQCNSLRNQARKASRHRRLTRRLQRLQQRLIVTRHERLAEEFRRAEERRAEAQKNFESAAAQAATAEAAVVGEQQKLEEAQRELQRLQQARFELQSKVDREKHRVELCNRNIENIDARMATIEKELESRRARVTILRGTIEALELDWKREEEKLGNGNAELARKAAELDETKRRNAASQDEIARLRAEVRELEQRRNVVQNDRRVAEQMVARLTDEMGQTEFQLSEMRGQVAALEAEFAKHEARVAELGASLQSMRGEVASIQESIRNDDQVKRELSQRLEALTREMHQTTSRLQALKELEDSYEGYFRGVKEVMLAGERGQVNGIVGVVSSLIAVPKHLEIAVEVALGSDVQDIVTQSVTDAKQAIGFLKARNLGRATFLPLDFLHVDFPTRHLEPIWGRQGILGLGRDLVQYDPKIQAAVWYLFGNTVFVDNLDIAVDLEREGIRNRFVSLTGDVVNPRGVLSGGSHQTRGLLTRQREIRQLADRVRALEDDLKKLQAEIATNKDRLGGLYARAAELQANIHKMEIEESNARKDLQAVERERRDKKNQSASAEARATQQRLDLARQQEIAAKSAEALSEFESGIASKGDSLAAKEAGAGESLARQQSLSEEVAVARQAMHSQAEVVSTMRRRLDETAASLTDSETEREAREKEKTTLLGERERTLLDRDEAEQSLAESIRAHEEAQNAATDRAAANEAASSELRRLQGDAARLVRDRNERDNVLREAEMKSTELKAQVEYVEREAEDEFALTIDEVRTALAEAEEADRLLRERLEAERVAEKERKKAERAAARQKADGAEGAAEEAVEEEKPAAAASDDDESGEPLGTEEPATTPEDDAIVDPSQLRALVADLRQKLQRLGAVNEAAIEEYATQSERLKFITAQRDDVVAAKQQLEEAIAKIDETTKDLFEKAYAAINENFGRIFSILFNGGKGELVMVQEEGEPEPGIDIYAAPPGKKIGGSITLMSGGEKALTAIALMFAMFQHRPSPICILDEIDAPLDDVNVGRMCNLLKTYARDTQFLIITHNKITMSLADTIYGVTMQEPGVSKVVSVKFDEVEEAGLLEPAATAG